MYTKDEAYEILKDVVEHNRTHKNYDRTVKLADLYYKLYTGDGVETLLKKFVTRESEALFTQRKEITQTVTPAVLHSTKLFYEKVSRTKPLNRDIIWPGENYDQKKQEVESAIAKHYGGMSLDQYLELNLINANYADPNSYNIVEFKEFDPDKEKPKPYSFIASAAECVMMEYDNGTLEYLIIKQKFQDKENKEYVKYTGYFGNDTLTFTETRDPYVNLNEGDTRETEFGDMIKLRGKYYLVNYFEPKAGQVNAQVTGFIPDPVTGGETYVSVFHCALCWLMKSLKINSELDLSIDLVTFPERFAYVPKCSAEACLDGRLPDGSTCKVCQGTGEKHISTTAAEVTTVKLPKDPKDIIDLNMLSATKSPPIDLLKFMSEFVEYLKVSVHKTMFNADLFSKTEVTATATEKNLERDNMDDTLYPYARKYSEMWRFITEVTATYLDYPDAIVIHKMPDRYNMKSLSELFAELQQVKTAGGSASTVAAIEDDINDILYANRPEELRRIRVKNLLNPFRGFSEQQVNTIISSGRTTKYNAVLYDNFETIMAELEQENTDLYAEDMNTAKIRTLLAKKVQDYIDKIEGEKPDPVQMARFDEA